MFTVEDLFRQDKKKNQNEGSGISKSEMCDSLNKRLSWNLFGDDSEI